MDLRDLAHRYVWNARAIAPFIAAAELDVAPAAAWRGFAPPCVLVVIVPHHDPNRLLQSRPWLADAGHLIIVRDGTADRDLLADPEMRALAEEPWHDVLRQLPLHEVIDWWELSDGAPQLAVQRAIAHPLAAARPKQTPCANPDLELPASAWVSVETAFAFTLPSRIAARLAIRDGRAVLLDGRVPSIELVAPTALTVKDLDGAPSGLPFAPATSQDHHSAYGQDPVHPVVWRGHRMAVYWWYVGAAEIGFLSATDHDWPCGPAKKLWGYENNDPVAIALAPRGDVCVQTFEHDTLITVGMPIGWHRAGHVDVALFAPDPRRAVFYAQTTEFQERATGDLLDEDNRELAPVVVLGPDDEARYAIDLRHRVVRIVGTHGAATGEIIGGPNEGYAVFDADHQLVRRGTGMLLGGWFQHATIEDEGALWREDLAYGERTLLGSTTRCACVDPDAEMVVQDAIREGRHDDAAKLRASHATRAITGDLQHIAIPGTRNVIEIAGARWRVL